MPRIISWYFACVLAASGAGAGVRDERSVLVNGKLETWRLEWTTAAKPICEPQDIGWHTCPCAGFHFGESGQLELARIVDGKEIDRLDLSPFFWDEDNNFSWRAYLQRWPVLDTDVDETIKGDAADDPRAALAAFAEKVRARKPVPILEVADFNRDGWATEFVLQTATRPCGKRESILIGVSPDKPRLHAFGTAEHPAHPLHLYVEHWPLVAKADAPLTLEMWTCGDHGSDRHQNITVKVDAHGMHALREFFACAPSPKNGQRLEHETL